MRCGLRRFQAGRESGHMSWTASPPTAAIRLHATLFDLRPDTRRIRPTPTPTLPSIGCRSHGVGPCNREARSHQPLQPSVALFGMRAVRRADDESVPAVALLSVPGDEAKKLRWSHSPPGNRMWDQPDPTPCRRAWPRRVVLR